MTKKTAKTLDDVRQWVSNNLHHKITKLNHRKNGEYDAIRLSGHGHSIKIPKALWERCFLRPAGPDDGRLYLWDYQLETNAKQGKSNDS